jgi:prephenate dehydrogenase
VSRAIKIVGAGLIGTSLGLALARKGLIASLSDHSETNLRLAIEYGAGTESVDEPDLVIVCVPPGLTAKVICEQLAIHKNAIVTDVASVKLSIAKDVKLLSGPDSARYIGSHPMAGRETSGPKGARADLFFARPWVITPDDSSAESQVEVVTELALMLDALPVVMSAQKHDDSVALVSHLPQLVSSALAARLASGSTSDLNLAGQGLRDTTRIAASDPDLWLQILSQNAAAIGPLLVEFSKDINDLVESFQNSDESSSNAIIHSLLTAGNQGVSSIPGKHGGKYLEYKAVTALIDDSPGALAALLTFVGEIGVNLEDIKLEHSPGAAIGLVEMQVLPAIQEKLMAQLVQNGWRLA